MVRNINLFLKTHCHLINNFMIRYSCLPTALRITKVNFITKGCSRQSRWSRLLFTASKAIILTENHRSGADIMTRLAGGPTQTDHSNCLCRKLYFYNTLKTACNQARPALYCVYNYYSFLLSADNNMRQSLLGARGQCQQRLALHPREKEGGFQMSISEYLTYSKVLNVFMCDLYGAWSNRSSSTSEMLIGSL